ncbi:methyltransferase family protein [Desulfamplus magnetovallimortis]|nr:isoprenylcysteine carboxylmethyltransferase family protein [Desulfamplus magnetovallimortis]
MTMGAFTGIASLLAFRMKKTTVDPRYPDNASSLVVKGIYRRTRNPMYLALLLILLAWAAYLSNPVTLAGAWGFYKYITLFQILPEERVLHEKFGTQYQNYISSVNRWFSW